MIDLDIPEDFEKIIRDKRVVIVGPAEYLTGRSSGTKIDNYDVVIRPNCFFLPEKAHVDYGSRTDIMYHNMASVYLSGLQEQVKNNPEVFKSLQYVVGSAIKAGPQDHAWSGWSDDHKSECATNFDKLKIDEVPYWWIGVPNYKKTHDLVGGCEPYTGISSIIITTACKPKELHVTGFDFYSGSKVYADGYLASVDRDQEIRNRGGGHGSGCTDINKNYVRSWKNEYNFVSVDDHMESILTP